jgi:hypothetical protein
MQSLINVCQIIGKSATDNKSPVAVIVKQFLRKQMRKPREKSADRQTAGAKGPLQGTSIIKTLISSLL